MEIFTTIVTFITSLPTAAFTGIVMGLMCVVFRGGMKNAVRACCCFMVGIAGITLLINYCVTEMQGVAEGIASTLGITLNVIDGGYGAIPYYGYVELLFPALACIIVLDIIMIGLGWTKVLWVDIHNTWHGLFVGLIAYAITDDYVLSLIITVIVLIILLKLADFVAPRFQEFNNTPGVCCIASSATMAGLFTCIVMKVIDKIPGLNSIKFSAEDIQDRFGIFGEQIVLGAIIGLVLGLCAGFDITGILECSVTLAATLALFPKMAAFVCEGIVPVTTCIMTWMKKKFKGRRDLYIAVDPATLLGDPSVMATFVIEVPIMIVLCLLLPGVGFIPIASLAALPYIVGGVAPYARGNMVHCVICTTLYLVLISYIATWMAPATTMGIEKSGLMADTVGNGALLTCWDEGGSILAGFVRMLLQLFGIAQI